MLATCIGCGKLYNTLTGRHKDTGENKCTDLIVKDA